MIDLKAIERRAAKATPVDDRIMRFRYQHGGGRMIRDERELVLDVYDEANREFYFSARTDIPALCQEVRELRLALLRYGDHEPSCEQMLCGEVIVACTCGWEEQQRLENANA